MSNLCLFTCKKQATLVLFTVRVYFLICNVILLLIVVVDDEDVNDNDDESDDDNREKKKKKKKIICINIQGNKQTALKLQNTQE